MNNWKEITLKEVCEKITKGTTPATEGGGFSSSGINFIKAESITDDGRFIKNKFTFINEETNSKLKRSIILENDLLYSIAGVIGRTVLVGKDVLPANTNQALAILRLNQEKVIPKYIYYYLSNKQLVRYANSLVSQSVQANINLTQLGEMPIFLPPFTEQKAIAVVLASLDDKIELLRRQNETLEKIAQTIFKRWFVEFEFPDKNGKPYKSSGGKMIESELGEIPEGWKFKELGEVVNIKQGKYINTEEISNVVTKDNRFPFYGGNGIRGYVKDFVYENPQVILTCRGNGCGLIMLTEGKSAISNSCMALEDMDSMLSSLYLYLWAKKISFDSVTSGSAQPQITVTNLYSLEVIVPQNNILEIFNNLVKPVFKKIENNSDQIQIISRLRDSLLPKLMSGEVRLINN